MKHIFLFCFMIFALLMISTCAVDAGPQGNKPENSQTQGEQEPETAPPVEVPPSEGEEETSPQGEAEEETPQEGEEETPPQGEAEEETPPSEGEEETPPESVPPVEMPPEIVPHKVVPHKVVPHKVVPHKVVPHKVVPHKVVPHKVVPHKVVPHKVVPHKVVPPKVVPPVVVPPEAVPPEVEPPEVEPPEVVPPEEEPPEVEPPVDDTPELAVLRINELRTEFLAEVKRAEFVEFKVLQAGNLEGLYLYIMTDPVNPFIYEFPAVDVGTGEYITLHLQTFEINCVDEIGDNLSLSGGNDSCATARDLWVKGTKEWLHKTEIVFLQDDDERIIDAIVMNENPSAAWNNSQAYFTDITDNLYNCGMWKSADGNKPTPSDAVNTSAIDSFLYKSVSRYELKENTHSAKDWYVTALFDNTPGLPNY